MSRYGVDPRADLLHSIVGGWFDVYEPTRWVWATDLEEQHGEETLRFDVAGAFSDIACCVLDSVERGRGSELVGRIGEVERIYAEGLLEQRAVLVEFFEALEIASSWRKMEVRTSLQSLFGPDVRHILKTTHSP